MKKTFYFVFTLVLCVNIFAQDSATGFYPPSGSLCIDSNNDTIDCDVQTIQQLQSITQIIGPSAYLNTAYNDTILFYADEDYSIVINEQELEFLFISAQILSVSVPDGMTYSCNNDDCTFYPNEWGNIIMTGTPLTTGTFHLDIQAEITLNLAPLGLPADVSINIPYDGSNELLNFALGGDYSIINNIVPDIILVVFEQADPIYGCTNFYSANYDALATTDDGSCEYTCEVPVEWEVENTGSNMTLMIPGNIDVSVNGTQLSGGSALGVFYEDSFGALQCAGYTHLTGDTTHIAVMADDATTEEIDGLVPGTQMIWKIWDGVSCIEYSATAVFSMGSNTFTLNGIAFVESVSYSCQDIEFPSGWFMFSTYIESEDMDVASVLSSLADNIIIVKNNSGEAYLPEWNFNGIGAIVNGQGYSIKLEENDQIEICGNYLIPESNSIELSAGWNTIGYLRIEPSNVEMIMEPLVTIDNLIIVKDYNGNPYLPEWNFNGLGNMYPGQGYQLKINVADTLQYLSNDQEYRLPTVGVIENNVEHFTKTIPTGNNMQIVIPDDAWTLKPEIGSEIAAYTVGGILVGSAIYSRPTTVLTVWGDDITTASIDGLLIDEPVIFKVWDKAGIRDFKIENWVIGANTYQIDAIHVAGAIEIEDFLITTNLFDAIPNPSHTKTNISFFVAQTSKVNISVYNVIGELVEVLANSVYQTGAYQLEMSVSQLETGCYYYTMRSGEYEKTKQLVILKE